MNYDRYATIRETDNRSREQYKQYTLQLVLERDALRAEVHRLRGLVMQLSQKVEDGEYSCHACSLSAGGICRPHVEVLHMRRQAMKETVRHESGGDK